jgi:hypothetical protein
LNLHGRFAIPDYLPNAESSLYRATFVKASFRLPEGFKYGATIAKAFNCDDFAGDDRHFDCRR